MKTKSAATAILLSFTIPALGHLYLGRRRQALLFALLDPLRMVAAGLDHRAVGSSDPPLGARNRAG